MVQGTRSGTGTGQNQGPVSLCRGEYRKRQLQRHAADVPGNGYDSVAGQQFWHMRPAFWIGQEMCGYKDISAIRKDICDRYPGGVNVGYYDELLDFCHRYKSIYCYGAGNYGMQVLKFLKRNKIIPECFLVSKLSEDVKRNTGTEVQAGTGKESEAEIKETDIKINGIPVHTLDHIKSQADLQSGIILSLHEKHHKSIISHLRQSGFRNIFPVTSDDIDLKI